MGVTAEPYLAKGKLAGFTLVFSAILQDWRYRQGAYLAVNGNVGIMAGAGTIGTNLKVVVNEFDVSISPMRYIPSAPSRAYLINWGGLI